MALGSDIFGVVLLAVLLVVSAGFSASETAFFSLRRGDLADMEAAGTRAGRRVAALARRSTDLLSALLIGNLLVNTAASVVATGLILRWAGTAGLAYAVPAITLILLLFGEITPKMAALGARVPVAVVAQAPLGLWLKLTAPLLRGVGLVVERMIARLPLERTGSLPLSVAELQMACDLAVEDGILTETEGRSLARLLQLEDLEVKHIMTPRTAVVTLRRDMDLAQVLAVARKAGFNRYPVLEEDGDRPLGLFHLKDLLRAAGGDRPLQGALRPMLFVPESMDVAALLVQMRSGSTHLAAVVDEHGDFTGIVSMADCLQALLGSVADASGADSQIVVLGEGRWVIHGGTDLRELEEACGILLPPSNDYVTVAGFMMSRLGRLLKPGDRVNLPQGRLTVLTMTGHRVDRIQVTRLQRERDDGSGGAA